MTFLRKLLGLHEKSDALPRCVVVVNNVTGVSTFTGHSFDLNHATGVGTCKKCGFQLVNTELAWAEIENGMKEDGCVFNPRLW